MYPLCSHWLREATAPEHNRDQVESFVGSRKRLCEGGCFVSLPTAPLVLVAPVLAAEVGESSWVLIIFPSKSPCSGPDMLESLGKNA